MPRIERVAEIVWEGNLARGAGAISAGTGAFSALPYTNTSRIAKPEDKTSPEELLAAAHGGCFTMSLAGELTALGHPPERLDATCLIVMDEVEGQGHQILESHVTAHVAVEGLEEAALQAALERADAECPFSQLLKRAGVNVQISATLA